MLFAVCRYHYSIYSNSSQITKGTVMHMLGEWNSLGEKSWGLHVLMQIYYFLRSSGTGSLKSRIRDCVYIFSIWVLLNCNAWDTLLLSWSERKQSVMLFLLFIYSLLSGVSAERSGTDCHDRVTIWVQQEHGFFSGKFVFCKDVSQCVQRRGELYLLSHLHLLLATQTILRLLSCQVVSVKICHAEDS